MEIAFKTPIKSLILLTLLTICCIHVNKYILSVLGFSYPTVFQGWQTLVAVILMRYILFDHITPLSWSSFLSHLPLFVSFVGGIVAGSKALSILPVPVIIAVSNVIPALEHIIKNFYISNFKNSITIGAGILCMSTSLGIFYTDPVLSEISSASIWISIHLLFTGAQSIYDHVFVSSNFSPLDKLFYCNLFSLIVLAPSSLYLEEAFEALHFQERRQVSFLFGCVLSGVLGTVLTIFTIQLSTEQPKVLAASRSITCLVSPFIFPCAVNYSTWAFIISNLITICLIPLDQCSFQDIPVNKKFKLSEQV